METAPARVPFSFARRRIGAPGDAWDHFRDRGNDSRQVVPGATDASARIQKRPARGQAFLHYRGSTEAYATVDARSAAMRSSSGGWLMNSFLAVEPAMPKAAICVGSVLWP